MEGQAGAAQSTVAKQEPRGRGSQRAVITEQTAPNAKHGSGGRARSSQGVRSAGSLAQPERMLGARYQTVRRGAGHTAFGNRM